MFHFLQILWGELDSEGDLTAWLLTLLLPKDFYEREKTMSRQEIARIGIKPFVRLFGVAPEMSGSNLYPGCPFYQGTELKKEEIFRILRENDIIGDDFLGIIKGEILMLFIFPISFLTWYRFAKLRTANGDTVFQLRWETSNDPA